MHINKRAESSAYIRESRREKTNFKCLLIVFIRSKKRDKKQSLEHPISPNISLRKTNNGKRNGEKEILVGFHIPRYTFSKCIVFCEIQRYRITDTKKESKIKRIL
jgi:hypothetical protein